MLGDRVPRAGCGAHTIHLELENPAVHTQDGVPCALAAILELVLAGVKVVRVDPGGALEQVGEMHVPGDAADDVYHASTEFIVSEDGVNEELWG